MIKATFFGGPLDGDKRFVPVQDNGKPFHIYQHRLAASEKPSNDSKSEIATDVDIANYLLHEITFRGKPSSYEYHYKGR